jgi:hypothetical protein
MSCYNAYRYIDSPGRGEVAQFGTGADKVLCRTRDGMLKWGMAVII